MHADIESRRESLRSLCRQYGVERLEAFGSATREHHIDPSRRDIDMLVEFEAERRNDLLAFDNLRSELEALFGRRVDLVDRAALLESRNSLRRDAILREAQSVVR